MKDNVEIAVRTMLKNDELTISQFEYEKFMEVLRYTKTPYSALETALAYVVCVAFDKDEFICKRNNRREDFAILSDVFVNTFRKKNQLKSFLVLVTEAIRDLNVAKDIAAIIMGGKQYEFLRGIVRPIGDVQTLNGKGIAAVIPAPEALPTDAKRNSPEIAIGKHLVAGESEIDPTKKINLDLDRFILYILDPKNADNVEGYISSRKVSDKDLELNMGYLNGAAYINGLVFDSLVVIRYNIYHNPAAFHVKLDGDEMPLPITINNLVHFLTHGQFLKGTLLK